MRVITLGSGKGGTGKSFVAANLGIALARRGIRTCLVDLDLGSADLHLMLGQLRPRHGVHEVLRGEAATLSDVVQPIGDDGRLSLVAGAGETVRAAGLSAREIDALVRDVRDLPADVVVVDLPGGVAHQVLDLFLAGDTQLLVTTPDPVAVNDAARFLRLCRMRRAARDAGTCGADRRPRVYTSLDELVRDMNAIREAELTGGFRPGLLLNRCRPAVDRARAELIGRLSEEVGDDAELALHAEIPEDGAVERSIRLLSPLVEIAPTAPASRTIQDLAMQFAPPHQAESWPPEPAGFLHRAGV